jgi:hypothetical protein
MTKPTQILFGICLIVFAAFLALADAPISGCLFAGMGIILVGRLK